MDPARQFSKVLVLGQFTTQQNITEKTSVSSFKPSDHQQIISVKHLSLGTAWSALLYFAMEVSIYCDAICDVLFVVPNIGCVQNFKVSRY